MDTPKGTAKEKKAEDRKEKKQKQKQKQKRSKEKAFHTDTQAPHWIHTILESLLAFTAHNCIGQIVSPLAQTEKFRSSWKFSVGKIPLDFFFCSCSREVCAHSVGVPMKLSRFFSKKSLSRSNVEKKRVLDASKGKLSAPRDCNNEDMDAIEWELRPGGMLVQKRRVGTCVDVSPSSGPLIKVRISHGHYQHDVTIPAYATFGDLKWLLAQEVGLQPHEQRLIFQGKEKDSNEFLHIAGVKDMAKVILVEDPASKEKKLEEMKRDNNVGNACQAIALIQSEVDKLAGQISALDAIVSNGGKVPDHDFKMLAEVLMQHLTDLDRIHAEGEAKVQRRIEARRVQSISEHLENIKIHNRNYICNDAVVITTNWETFDSGDNHPSSAPATISTTWEVF